jgi:hypothetical protein
MEHLLIIKNFLLFEIRSCLRVVGTMVKAISRRALTSMAIRQSPLADICGDIHTYHTLSHTLQTLFDQLLINDQYTIISV